MSPLCLGLSLRSGRPDQLNFIPFDFFSFFPLSQESKTTFPGEEQQEAFGKGKKSICETSFLLHYDPEWDLVVSCGASPYGVARGRPSTCNGRSVRATCFLCVSRFVQSQGTHPDSYTSLLRMIFVFPVTETTSFIMGWYSFVLQG